MSWSNPSSSGVFASQAAKGVGINPINIAGLVSAILENKQRQRQQQQQDFNNVISGINSIGQAYQGGQADDAANAALYQAQYGAPPDSPDQVPDYGGRDALAARQQALKLQEMQQELSGNPQTTNVNGIPMYRDRSGWHPFTGANSGRLTPYQQNELNRQHAADVEKAQANQLKAYDTQLGDFGYGANDILNAKPGFSTQLGSYYSVGNKQGSGDENDYSNVVPADKYKNMLSVAQQRQQLLQHSAQPATTSQQSSTGFVPGSTVRNKTNGKLYQVDANGIPVEIPQ